MDSVATTLNTYEQNMRLIGLAFDCVFITSSEKEKTIRLLEEKSKDDSCINVTDIFKQENLISDKRIEYLLAFDRHLQIQCHDQQFGMLATANGLASEEEVANALRNQKTYFENNRINMKIGDILVGNGSITNSDRVAILLTQNRIKDEKLLDALNDLGETQRQKDVINKRFGVLAIKRELVTMEQVNAALEIQKNETSTQEPRFIGEILQETADLSYDDILQILLEQKQFEKRGFDLEKALYTVKSEIKISKKLNRLFEYSISKDGLGAYVKKRMEIEEAIPIYEFLIWLRRVGIKFGIEDDAVLEEFIQKAEKKSQINVAKGYPPEQSLNESIQFYFEKENSDPILIKKGSILAKIIPGKEGKPGKDVLGYPIQPDKPSICVLNAGSWVIKKGHVFFAQIEGHPILKNGITLMVEPVVKKDEIKTIIGKISNDTKDTYESAIVELSGGITQEAVLRCHSLFLQGHLMGRVICTGEINVNGDVGTDEESKDEDTYQAEIICQGSVKVSKSIINSKIQTHELLAFNSTVAGSEVIAFKGMTIGDSLKGKNTPSILRFGIKPGDEIIAVDHTIETKNAELFILKKEKDIRELTEKYRKDLKEDENHQLEQEILKNLIQIIDAPELYQYEGLEGKINYLYNLPEFSSVKTYYLKLPETDTALTFLNQIMRSTEKMSLENVLKEVQKKIDPEPEDENVRSNRYRIETIFKAGIADFKQEILNKSEEIKKMENEIKGLQLLREKLGSIHVNSLSRSAIKIKNKCEKGTIIKGKIAQLIVEETLYNVTFKEVIDRITNTASISIET